MALDVSTLTGTDTGSGAQYDITYADGLALYVDYTKGSEDGISLQFKGLDNSYPVSASWFNITTTAEVSGGAVINLAYTITATGKYVFPVHTARSIDVIDVIVTETGGTPDGTVVLYGVPNNRYS